MLILCSMCYRNCVVQVSDRDIEMVAGAVTAGTRQGHHAAFLLWKSFIDTTDNYPGRDPFLEQMDENSRSICINRFLDWLITSNRITPSVAGRMVTSVRHHFQNYHQPTEAFDSIQVRNAKKSVLKGTLHVRFVERLGKAGPLPFTLDLTEMARDSYWRDPGATVDMKMTYIGVALGVATGSRPGEIAYAGPYVGDPKYTKARAEDHRYFTTDVILESQVRQDGGQAIFTYNEARKLPHPRPVFELIRMTKDSSKTSGGKADGLTHYFTRGNEMETQFFDDLISWMLDLCQLPLDTPGGHMICSRSAFVSRQASRCTIKMLTTKMYTALIKLVAAKNNLPEDCFSGKSTRVNAVTSATMAGAYAGAVPGHASLSGASHYHRNIHSKRSKSTEDHDLLRGLPSGATVNAFSIKPVLKVQDLQRSVAQSQRLAMGRRGPV